RKPLDVTRGRAGGSVRGPVVLLHVHRHQHPNRRRIHAPSLPAGHERARRSWARATDARRVKPTVLVADGEQRAALAIVRSLGGAGSRVVVVSRDGRSLAGASRYADLDVPAPSPLSEPEAFAERIAELARKEAAGVVLPVTDASVLALLPRRARPAPCALPFPPPPAFG